MTMSHSQKIRYQKLKRKRDNESKRYNDEESEEDEEDYLKEFNIYYQTLVMLVLLINIIQVIFVQDSINRQKIF